MSRFLTEGAAAVESAVPLGPMSPDILALALCFERVREALVECAAAWRIKAAAALT